MAVGRRGKHLLLDFGAVTFVVHLMQGGRLKPDEKQSAKPRFGQARWRFADGRALLLTEAGTERKAGVWVVAGDPERAGPAARARPGRRHPRRGHRSGGCSPQHPMRLHGFLRDQHVLAGLGRLLANEICHRARLSPFANTAKLGDDEVARLARGDPGVHRRGPRLRARARRDERVADRPARVHHRVGEACPVCGDTVRAVEYSRYTVAYCATCQTGGKVLADNTTSKFLK